ncbi:unnamed protein product [Clavelina lepadiformis]|uniref:Uncharacterized protein n=1 Tax=Clavelina lepadiformis TaxID=159417 RepID=A0ABP0GNA8_CLALP
MANMDTSELQPAVKLDSSVKSRVSSPMSRSSPTNAQKIKRRNKRRHKCPRSLRKKTLQNQHQKKTEERVKNLDIQLMFFLQVENSGSSVFNLPSSTFRMSKCIDYWPL